MKKKSAVRSVLQLIYSVIADFIILIGVIIVLLFCFGIRMNSVKTGSMEPTIHTGSLCLVNKNTDYYEIKEGDIITFLIDEKMNVTHRVKEISDKGFITKGDANNTEDAVIVTEKEYVGKVILSISMIGYIFLFIHTKYGLVITIAVFVIFIILGFLIRDDEENEDKD